MRARSSAHQKCGLTTDSIDLKRCTRREANAVFGLQFSTETDTIFETWIRPRWRLKNWLKANLYRGRVRRCQARFFVSFIASRSCRARRRLTRRNKRNKRQCLATPGSSSVQTGLNVASKTYFTCLLTMTPTACLVTLNTRPVLPWYALWGMPCRDKKINVMSKPRNHDNISVDSLMDERGCGEKYILTTVIEIIFDRISPKVAPQAWCFKCSLLGPTGRKNWKSEINCARARF